MGERDGGSENVDARALRSEGEEERRGASGFTSRAWVAGVAVLLAGLGLILLGEDVADPIERGSVAPDFELTALPGDDELTLSQFRGRVVLLNFWATWCKPCEDEIPSMEQLYRGLRRQDEGFELLAVSVDESPTAVRDFMDQHSISFPVLLDPQQQVSRLYQTRGFPESLLIDRRGRVVERYVGPRDWLTYRGRILELIREG